MKEIKHFDHRHLLSLSNKTRNDEIHCEACSKDCVGQTYICSEGCRYGLHESCAKLPQQLQSRFHPPHPLTLQRLGSSDITCDACTQYCFTGFIFCCNKCNFELDLECASMMPAIKEEAEGQGKLQFRTRTYPHHRDPLLIFEKGMPNNRFRCAVCREYCSDPDPIYCCIPCRFFLHGSCFEMKLPPETQHFYHPHPLTLCTTQSGPDPDITCKACYKLLKVQDWYYSCKKCDDFVMDIDCTLLPISIDIDIKSQSQIHHFLHAHPLTRRKNKLQDDHEKVVHDCCVCGKGCIGTTYFCERGSSPFCKKSYFHKSCLELPQQICHPFHPYHPLTLTLNLQEGKLTCNSCRKSTHAFTSRTYTHSIAYICESHNNCGFLLHAECSEMMPAMTYEGQTHLLRFREDNMENDKLKCNGCKSNICESHAFTCLYCDLNLHLLCGPLPYIIKHKDHINPLILTNSPVAEEVEDETSEFYCHVCEEKRDPLLPVYYCAESEFVAEFKCVYSQILSSLKGEYGDIELRTTLGLQGKLITAYSAKESWPNEFEQVHQTSTLSDILGSSRKDVVKELSNAYVAMKTATAAKDNDSEYWEDMLLSDKAYTQFIKFLDCGREIVQPWKTPEETVKVGDYVVPTRLTPIIKHLLSKHGDVSAKSTVSPMAKQYLYIVLCECLYSMTNTRVVDITKDLLLIWWTSFKVLESTRFEIQFALNHLKRVAHAFFGFYVKRRIENIDGDIAKLSIELQNLQNKIETLKNKRDLESVTSKSKSIEECLREASALQYGKASSGLLRIL